MIRVSGSTLDLKQSFLDNLKPHDTMNDFFDVINMHSALGDGDHHSSWSDTEHRIFFLNRYLDMLKAAARERELNISSLNFRTYRYYSEGHADHQDDTRMQEYMKNDKYKEKASTFGGLGHSKIDKVFNYFEVFTGYCKPDAVIHCWLVLHKLTNLRQRF